MRQKANLYTIFILVPLLVFSFVSQNLSSFTLHSVLAPKNLISSDPKQLSREEKREIRTKQIFGHLRGLALVPVMRALIDGNIFWLYQMRHGNITVEKGFERLGANKGYLRGALRLLTSYGWMRMVKDETGIKTYYLTSVGKEAYRLISENNYLYGKMVSFISIGIKMDDFLFGNGEYTLEEQVLFDGMATFSKNRWSTLWPSRGKKDESLDELRDQLTYHLDGYLVSSIMVTLARKGIFKKIDSKGKLDIEEIVGNKLRLEIAFNILQAQGWLNRSENQIQFTPEGLYAIQKVTSNGVPKAYAAMFKVLPTLLFGDVKSIRKRDEKGKELLVNRPMNVWGSGGAHKSYFKYIDKIIIDIFNRPIEEQPKGICDMGCGDGTLLQHLYEVVKTKTKRGKVLDKYPVILVGADFNQDSREATEKTLTESKISGFHVIEGTVNDPDQLAQSISDLGLNINNFLHVRSFLDHNRIYEKPEGYTPGSREATTTGAFALEGDEIPEDELEENLVRHLKKWEPYVRRFGLINLELHTLDPEIAAKHIYDTLVIPYDATHIFSDQYLVEIDVWLRLAKEAGLVSDPRYNTRFPDNELGTISVNHFLSTSRINVEPPSFELEEAI